MADDEETYDSTLCVLGTEESCEGVVVRYSDVEGTSVEMLLSPTEALGHAWDVLRFVVMSKVRHRGCRR